ncbi:hypothetical protein K488DRAFT_85672 [Vararia minispora EC-137]|uniref:Uncharacterized protein n=1 Tax=Vararia minispora EC-137 TaxID=1314806 RepID=A0ACB8QLU3_9AGAM|nr:hypothetical protein K488DRAFT_85672 [Vararia minispora EC-137]
MDVPISQNVSMDSVKDTEMEQPALAVGRSDIEMGTAPKVDRELDETELAAVRQVEFYFADANLPYDKFMWTLHTANPEHWVKVDQVASFKRMQDYKSQGRDWLVNALRYSTELEVDSDSLHVRRRTEVTEPKGQFERSVYAKGFGEEKPGLQKELENFFRKYGNVSQVRMRRDDQKAFKGSVFCEFTDFATVGAFLNADPKPSWNGTQLEIYTKEVYVDKKIKEKGLTGSAAAIRRQSMVRRGFSAFEEMRRAGKSDGAGAGKAPPKDVILQFLGNNIPVHGASVENAHVDASDIPNIPHTTLRFSGCGGQASFDDIKGPLKTRFTRVPFVKYKEGEDTGLVGFDRALTDEDVEYVKKTVPKINDKEVAWVFIDYEEERAFQVERAQSAAKRVFMFAMNPRDKDSKGTRDESSGGGRGRGRGRGRGGGRGGGRGRGRGRGGGSSVPASSEPSEDLAGEKRKRAVEPDGGHDVGVRGATVPAIATASKKQKVDGEE